MTTSILENPSFTFPEPGTYVVSFTVSLTNGQSATVRKRIRLTTDAYFTHFGVEYHFFFDPGDLCVTSYLWDFGDGTTSTEQNPLHTYPPDETYTPTVTVTYCDSTEDTTTLTEFTTHTETWCRKWDSASWAGLDLITDLDWLQVNGDDEAITNAIAIPGTGAFVGSGFTQTHQPIGVKVVFSSPTHITLVDFEAIGAANVEFFLSGSSLGSAGSGSSVVDFTADEVWIFVYANSDPSLSLIQIEGDGADPAIGTSCT